MEKSISYAASIHNGNLAFLVSSVVFCISIWCLYIFEVDGGWFVLDVLVVVFGAMGCGLAAVSERTQLWVRRHPVDVEQLYCVVEMATVAIERHYVHSDKGIGVDYADHLQHYLEEMFDLDVDTYIHPAVSIALIRKFSYYDLEKPVQLEIANQYQLIKAYEWSLIDKKNIRPLNLR